MGKVAGPLKSKLLSDNERLQSCAQVDPSHVQPGEPASEHVRLIQEALRIVANANIPATEKNYGDATTKAVVDFKTDRHIFTRGTTSIDPIVGINTIRELDKLLPPGNKDGPPGDPGVAATIRPDTPIIGDVDFAGFSAARLARAGNAGDWTRRDPFKPISQMVPVGQMRTLLVKTSGGAIATFSVDKGGNFASIVSSTDSSVTLSGSAPGSARLRVAVEGFSPVFVDIVVRASKSIPLDVFHLGPGGLAATNFQTAVIPGLNRVYNSQANLFFTAGAVRDISTMVMDGQPTALTASLPLFFSSLFGPPIATEPTFRFADLQREVKNAGAVTVFVSPNITDKEAPNIVGRGGLQTRVCWFTLKRIANASQVTLPAHEIGHSLGMPHITAAINERLLMNPVIQPNNLLIPSETLVDLRP